nr:SET-binding factor 2 [Polyrhizophydium stewartii]
MPGSDHDPAAATDPVALAAAAAASAMAAKPAGDASGPSTPASPVAEAVAEGVAEGIRKRQAPAVSLATSPSASSVLRKTHTFETKTFVRATYCDMCSQFIWGLAKQGEQCTACGYNAHHKCAPLVKTPCHPVRILGQQARGSDDRPATPRAEKAPSVPASPSATSLASSASQPQASSIVTELFANVQAETKKTEQTIKDINPPLTIATMLGANTRYVARQGPFIWLQETCVNLLMWQSPTNTLCFIFAYIIICLHPILFAILPQIAILYVIARSYHDRADKLMRDETIPPPPPPGTPPKIVMTNAQYMSNLQNIQNTMINISNAYDAGYAAYMAINWSDPERTKKILYMVLASMVGSMLLFYFVPLNIVMLWAGVGLFVANTAVVRAASITLKPVIVDEMKRRVDNLKETIMAARNAKGKETIVTVTVFENQRWWAERPAWSDESGVMPLPPKDIYELPSTTESVTVDEKGKEHRAQQVWEWVDEDWQIDHSLSPCDEGGWQFTDQIWLDPRSKAGLNSYTRRRKWSRRMRMLQ